MIKHRNSAAQFIAILSLALLLASLVAPNAYWRTTTNYDPQWRDPNGITEPTSTGSRVTVHTLDPRGNIKTRAVTVGTETRTSSFDYNSNGQVTRIDGPRSDVNDVTSYTYLAGTDSI